MNLDAVRRSLEPGIGAEALSAAALPAKLFDSFLLCGLRIDLNVPGRVICSISVPPRFVEEIEVDGQSLKSANPIGVAAVEIRNKKTGKIIAQARLSKDFSGSSKL